MSDPQLLSLMSAAAVLRKDAKLKIIFPELKKRKVSSRKIYEAILQTYLFAGYPSAIESFKLFAEYFPVPPASSEKDVLDFRVRGGKNCRKIYGDKFEKLLANIGRISPDLTDWLVSEGYGRVLGRRGLSLKERELCVISILTVTKFENQLYSHINGGIRTGLSMNEIIKAIENTDLLGSSGYKNFGLKVAGKFKEKKKGGQNKPPVE